jgi:4-hydroxy-tetrahydrodipicolinate synthase
MTELARLGNMGDFAAARAIQRRYYPLMQVNFIEANPGPVKWAMYRMGLLEPAYRLPMVAPSQASQEKIEQVLEAVGFGATVSLQGMGAH